MLEDTATGFIDSLDEVQGDLRNGKNWTSKNGQGLNILKQTGRERRFHRGFRQIKCDDSAF